MTKIPENHENAENVTDKPDTCESAIFVTFSLIIRHFRQKPLGLDRGLCHFCQSCPLVVSMVVPWCQKRQK